MPRSTDALRNPISVKKLAVPIVLKTAVMENDVYVYPGEWGVTDKGKI